MCSCIAGNFCETALDACGRNPCLWGGSCESVSNGFKCICPFGRTGKICEESKHKSVVKSQSFWKFLFLKTFDHLSLLSCFISQLSCLFCRFPPLYIPEFRTTPMWLYVDFCRSADLRHKREVTGGGKGKKSTAAALGTSVPNIVCLWPG